MDRLSPAQRGTDHLRVISAVIFLFRSSASFVDDEDPVIE
jgi:hypothetical protein